MRRSLRTAMAATLVLAAAACSADEAPPAEPTESTTSSEPTTSSDPSTGPLDWQPTGYDPAKRVVIGEKWTAIATESEVTFESATNSGAAFALPESGGSVDALLIEGEKAVVSYSFGGETTTGEAYVVDLINQDPVRIVTPEPANGGDWALDGDNLHYPALGEDQTACLANRSLLDGTGEDGWCPSERVGIAGLDANEDGVAAMLFDYASDVSCRTLTILDDAGVPQPVDGPAECTGWDIAATSTGLIWSEVPRAKRQEAAVFHATSDDAAQRLGVGTTGTLTSCGGDSFYVRDPRKRTDPARLMRWDGAELTVAYESTSKGDAFLGTPECADGILTLTSFGAGGDEQVSASVS